MNNNLYQWHDERMVDQEMEHIRHELGQANMFREVGGSTGRGIVGAVGAFLHLLLRRRRDDPTPGSPEQGLYQSRSGKAAP